MSSMFPHIRIDTATAATERRTPAISNDPRAVTIKALERWENEGGKIPELASGVRKPTARVM